MCRVSKSFVVSALLVLSLAMAQSAKGDLLSVQLQGPTSANFSGVEDSAATTDSVFADANVWNHLVGPDYPAYGMSFSASSLVNSTGAVTSAGFSVTASTLANGASGVAEGFTTNNGSTLRGGNFSLYTGSGHTSSRYLDWNVTGLAPNATAKMFFYPGGGTSLILSIDHDGNGDLDGSDISLTGTGGLVTVTASATGGIHGQLWTTGDNIEGDWSGFQVQTTATPEPSSMALIVTGLIGLLCYAWRRCK